MFGVGSLRLLGSQPAVLAVTITFNKFHLLYILPCVWKFFSNPLSDHNRYIIWIGLEISEKTSLIRQGRISTEGLDNSRVLQ